MLGIGLDGIYQIRNEIRPALQLGADISLILGNIVLLGYEGIVAGNENACYN